MLRRCGDQANWFLPFREMVYEEIRRTEFPAAVSRRDCVFCCEDETGLVDFVTKQNRAGDELYEVESVEENPTLFRADWSIVTGIGGQRVWDQLEEQARRYWSTQPTQDVEVLVASPVRVVRHIPR